MNALGFVWIVSVTLIAEAAYKWPSPQYDAIESQLFEGIAPNSLNLARATAQCQQRNKLATSSPVAAEWLRLAYHDVATHNIDSGSGGLDASIIFELDREENVGKGMTESLFQDFSQGLTKYVSYSDLIAMGVVWGVASCGGPFIPFRGGRIDATRAGPLGVPKPDQDLDTHTEKFRKQGFSKKEMIQLVACGHTIGGVRSPDFPNLVASGPDPTAPDFERVAPFDGSDSYDHSIVSSYLDGTTPDLLVTTPDKTFASDLRIFSSDKNATMESMNTDSSFASTCRNVLTKMISTVPRSTQLTDDITLLPVKVQWANIIFEDQLLLNIAVRFAVPIDSEGSTHTKDVKLYWCDRRGPLADCARSKANLATGPQLNFLLSPLSEAMNISLQSYEFAAPIRANQSVAKFWFFADGVKYDNGGSGYKFQQDQLVLFPYIKEDRSDGGGANSLLIAGVRSESHPRSVTLQAYGATSSTLAPFKATIHLQPDPSRSAVHRVDGYSLYSGILRHFPEQITIDSEAQIDGVTYRDDFRSLFRDLDASIGLPKPVSAVSKVTI